MAKYVPIQDLSLWRNMQQELTELRDRCIVAREGLEKARDAIAETPVGDTAVEPHTGPSTAFPRGPGGKGPSGPARGA